MSDSELCLQEIGKRIMDRRKKLGLTQEALAEKGEVTTQFVSYAESGKRAMRPENLLKISSALEVSADYLLTGEIIDKDLLILSDKLRRAYSARTAHPFQRNGAPFRFKLSKAQQVD